LADKLLSRAKDISEKIGILDVLEESYKEISDLRWLQNDPKAALFYYKLHIRYRDSLSNEENTKKTV
jgi:hypothetical protein